MNRLIIFKKTYFYSTLLVFGIELLIGFFAHDQFIRPYVGDFLVAILLYCLIKSFIDYPYSRIAICVLLFSYTVEALQYIHIVKLIGLGDSRIANILIGNYFAWNDIVAYTLGILFVLIIEATKTRKELGLVMPGK